MDAIKVSPDCNLYMAQRNKGTNIRSILLNYLSNNDLMCLISTNDNDAFPL